MNWCVERDWGKKITTEEEKSLRQLDKIRKETKVKLLQLSIHCSSAFGCREPQALHPGSFSPVLSFPFVPFLMSLAPVCSLYKCQQQERSVTQQRRLVQGRLCLSAGNRGSLPELHHLTHLQTALQYFDRNGQGRGFLKLHWLPSTEGTWL